MQVLDESELDLQSADEQTRKWCELKRGCNDVVRRRVALRTTARSCTVTSPDAQKNERNERLYVSPSTCELSLQWNG